MTNEIRYGIALYILRRESEKDLFGVFEKLKEIGYDGIELLGFFGKKPGEIKRKLDGLALTAIGDHVNITDFVKEPDRVIGEHREAGCEYITIVHDKDAFEPGTESFSAMLKDMRVLIEKCLAANLTPQYHNINWDIAGERSYAEIVLDELAGDGLRFEPDLGWIMYGGADPIKFLAKYTKRCEVLHFKDIYSSDLSKLGHNMPGEVKREAAFGGFEFRPTGFGVVNFPRVMPFCLACSPRWIVTDHDLSYERNPYCDLDASLKYTRLLADITM
jgi:sugar phosphate isomerase/epimerase